MSQVINISHGDLDVPLNLTQITVSLEDGWVVIDYDAEFPGYSASAPLPAEITTGGRTVTRTESLPFMASLRVQDDLLLASGGPHIISFGDGAFEIDLTTWIEDVLPKREGAQIAATEETAASINDAGEVEIQVVWQNFGDARGSRAETLRVNDEALRTISVRDLPATKRADELVVFTPPDGDAVKIEIGTWETEVELPE